jgi:hypothetical protein
MVTSPAPSLTGLTLEAIIGKQVDSLFAAPQGPRKLAAPFQHVFLRNVADATVCFHLLELPERRWGRETLLCDGHFTTKPTM